MLMNDPFYRCMRPLEENKTYRANNVGNINFHMICKKSLKLVFDSDYNGFKDIHVSFVRF